MRRLYIRQAGCPVCGVNVDGNRRLYLPFQCASCSRPLFLIPHGSFGLQLVPFLAIARLAVAIYALLATAALFAPILTPRNSMQLFGFFGIAYGATDLFSACLMSVTGIVERPPFSMRQARPSVVIAMSFVSGILSFLFGVAGFFLSAPMR